MNKISSKKFNQVHNSLGALKLIASSLTSDSDILSSFCVLAFDEVPNRNFTTKEYVNRKADAKNGLNLVQKHLIAKEVSKLLKDASAFYDAELKNHVKVESNFKQPTDVFMVKIAKFGDTAVIGNKYHLVNPLTNKITAEYVEGVFTKEAAPTVPFADSDNEVIYENADYVITLTTVPTIPENIGDTAAFYTIKSNLGKGTRGGIVAQCVVVVNETGYALQGLKRYPEELEPSKLSEDTLMEAYSIVQKDYSYRAAEADKPVNASAKVTAKVDFNKLLQNKTFKDADDLENTINSFVAGGKVLKDDADGFTIEALEEDGKHTYKVYLLGNGGPSEEVKVEKVEELTEQEEKPAVEKKADESDNTSDDNGDEKAKAVSQHTGEAAELTEWTTYGLPTYKSGDEEYAVASDEKEVYNAVVEEVESILDDVGYDAFNWGNMGGIENFVNNDWFEDARKESNESYARDIAESEPERFKEEAKEYGITVGEDIDKDAIYAFAEKMKENQEENPVEWFINNFGKDAIKDLIKEKKIKFDTHAIADEVINLDGAGHVLSLYDGNEVEQQVNGKTYFLYRQAKKNGGKVEKTAEEKIDFEKDLMEAGESKGEKDKVNETQLAMGKEVEKEHTTNPEIAEKITRDHLAEIPDYYTHLKEMEDNAKTNDAVKSSYAPFMTVDATKKEEIKIYSGDHFIGTCKTITAAFEKVADEKVTDCSKAKVFKYTIYKEEGKVLGKRYHIGMVISFDGDVHNTQYVHAYYHPDTDKFFIPEALSSEQKDCVELFAKPYIDENKEVLESAGEVSKELEEYTEYMSQSDVESAKKEHIEKTAEDVEDNAWVVEKTSAPTIDDQLTLDIFYVVNKNTHVVAHDAGFEPFIFPTQEDAQKHADKLNSQKEASVKPEVKKEAEDNTEYHVEIYTKLNPDDNPEGFDAERYDHDYFKTLEEAKEWANKNTADGKHYYEISLNDEIVESSEKDINKKADQELKQFDMKQELDGQKEFEKQDDFSQVSVPEEKEDTSEVTETMEAKPEETKGDSFSASEFGNNLAYIQQNNPDAFKSIMNNLKQIMVGDEQKIYNFLENWSSHNFQDFTAMTREDPTYARHSQYQEQLKNNVLPKLKEMSEYKQAMEEKVSAEKGNVESAKQENIEKKADAEPELNRCYDCGEKPEIYGPVDYNEGFFLRCKCGNETETFKYVYDAVDSWNNKFPNKTENGEYTKYDYDSSDPEDAAVYNHNGENEGEED